MRDEPVLRRLDGRYDQVEPSDSVESKPSRHAIRRKSAGLLGASSRQRRSQHQDDPSSE